MSDKRRSARRRALRAAQVVTIAGALVGCHDSHLVNVVESDAEVTYDAAVDVLALRDADLRDAYSPDMTLDTGAICPTIGELGWDGLGSCDCMPMAEACCAEIGYYSVSTGECCDFCPGGPMSPPEMISGS